MDETMLIHILITREYATLDIVNLRLYKNSYLFQKVLHRWMEKKSYWASRKWYPSLINSFQR